MKSAFTRVSGILFALLLKVQAKAAHHTAFHAWRASITPNDTAKRPSIKDFEDYLRWEEAEDERAAWESESATRDYLEAPFIAAASQEYWGEILKESEEDAQEYWDDFGE